MLGKRKMPVELIGRSDAESYHAVACLVTVLTVAQRQDAYRIGQPYTVDTDLTIAIKHLGQVIVSIGQIVAGVAINIEGMGSQEG